ncbi:DNA polymerase III subunit gamma/tau [Buchnera aphidicola]|uniref:DNA polymerase III subunit gamma/tau n=1 Tax=Buchnera aphidicola (Sarucallis kahawaluokalani) TaxID=1241878 RepID=A0A4D6YK85_9GAMM|nr:DNA polymerase III subunit gamma/tau [Buchnera aphidicola]QCI26098.1 DNA polymerase III subunit gamma/tau [Buchnera aphidicola (Sarucallis kahawaluokalani)]
MNYKILARKWRPKNFSEVIGQPHIIQTIKNSFLLNKIHQSWIFYGTHGTGKTTIARLLSQVLNCTNKKEIYQACHTCTNCKDIENKCFPDLFEIDAASKTKIEDIKELLDTIKYIPIQGKFKIYLIDEVHMLSKYSFNALLKILEEPPKYAKFILITTEIQKIPKTIISRCIFLHFKLINNIEIEKYLNKILKLEKIIFEPSALKILATYANGSIRDVLNLTEQMILFSNQNITKQKTLNMLGMLDKNQVLKIIISILQKDSLKLIKLLQKIYNTNISLEQIFTKILKILYDIIILQKIPEYYNIDRSSEYYNTIFKISQNVNYEELKKYYKIILYGKKKIHLFPNMRIGIELTLLHLLHIVHDKIDFVKY